jgi:hypothetical protein
MCLPRWTVVEIGGPWFESSLFFIDFEGTHAYPACLLGVLVERD